MSGVRITVVTRTCDRPDMLARAAQGLSAQDIQFDWIIVNDGQSDVDLGNVKRSGVTPVILKTAPSADARPKGRGQAGIIGMAAVKGQYILLHDDDDMLEPGALRRLAEYLDAHPHAVGVSGGHEVWHEGEGEPEKVSTYQSALPIKFYALAERNTLLTISTLFRRETYEAIGGLRTDMDALEDWDLWLRMMVKGDIDVISDVVARQYIRIETAAPALRNSRVIEHEEARIRLLNAYLRDDLEAGRVGLGSLVHRPHARFVEQVDDRLRRAGALKRKFMPWTGSGS